MYAPVLGHVSVAAARCQEKPAHFLTSRKMAEHAESADLAQLAETVQGAFPDGCGQWVTEAHVQRMLRATEGDQQLAVTKLKKAVAWKRDTLDGWHAAEAESLKSAETRVIAIGHDSRPLIYSGCVNQRKGEVAGIILACVWDRALQEAGPEIQMDYVLDGHGYQPLLNLNPMPYLRVAANIDSYFAERFHRIIVLDMPRVSAWLVKAIVALLPPKTKEKLFFIRRDNPDQMKALYELAVDDSMRAMLEELLKMNGEARSSDGREDTHKLTSAFLSTQNSAASD